MDMKAAFDSVNREILLVEERGERGFDGEV